MGDGDGGGDGGGDDDDQDDDDDDDVNVDDVDRFTDKGASVVLIPLGKREREAEQQVLREECEIILKSLPLSLCLCLDSKNTHTQNTHTLTHRTHTHTHTHTHSWVHVCHAQQQPWMRSHHHCLTSLVNSSQLCRIEIVDRALYNHITAVTNIVLGR